jgi:hypothetical protein
VSGLLAAIKGLFPGRSREKAADRGGGASLLGLLLFEQTGDVIQAEQALKQAGFAVRVVGPPPALRTGCDMAVQFDLVAEPAVRRRLAERGIAPLRAVPVDGPLLEPVSLVAACDLGGWWMVKAANMKITVDKTTGTIVNVSGGGCPDVPRLAELITGQRIDQCEEPRVQGQTLCSYALQLAFEEARRLWRG